MLQTRESDPNKPLRIMPYGPEGVGKSTLGAYAPDPVYISPEGGTDRIFGVREMVGTKDWQSLRENVKKLISEDHHFKTLVLDSADWIEGLCHRFIIGTSGKTMVTVDGGYGSGYRRAQNLHQELISDLETLREKRSMHIIVTAHSHVKPVKDPSSPEDYEAHEIKCHELVSSLWREWVDGLFFIRFHTVTRTSEETAKARAVSDGTRIIYTVKQPSFQAKNRFGMPSEMEFKMGFWKELMEYAKNGIVPVSASEIRKECTDLWATIQDPALKELVGETLSKAGDDTGQLLAIKKRLQQITNQKEG